MDQDNQNTVDMSAISSQDPVPLFEEMETDSNIMESKDISKPCNTQLINYSEKIETETEVFKLELPMQELIYCPEYSEQIMQAWKHLETLEKFSLLPEFLSTTNIPFATLKCMRFQLMDWLSALQMNLKLTNETLQLAINITDRFTAKCPSCISKGNYQMLGVAALSLASKFEEIFYPEFSDLCRMAEDSFSKQELAAMEKDVYFSLDFCISNPQPIHFLRFFSILLSRDQLVHTLAKYLLEVSLLQAEVAHMLPSTRAAVCFSLASRLLSHDVMGKLASLLQIEEQVMVGHEKVLVAGIRYVNGEKDTSTMYVYQKYACKRFNQISTLKCISEI